MSDDLRRAAAIQGALSREQWYVLTMRPNPDSPPAPCAPEEMRIVHHEYLLDLERRGILFETLRSRIVGRRAVAAYAFSFPEGATGKFNSTRTGLTARPI
jgi:hypothetical protein